MGEMSSYRVLVENAKERDHLEDTGVDGVTIRKWIKRNSVSVSNESFIWLKVRSSDGFL
jgi:hypothetical protein